MEDMAHDVVANGKGKVDKGDELGWLKTFETVTTE